MLIGIDMIALQSPGTRSRGIGRYVHNLLNALLATDQVNQYFLYYYDGLPRGEPPKAPNLTCRILPVEVRDGQKFLGEALEHRLRSNPDCLDFFVVTSPFEGLYHHYRPPAKPLNGLKLSVILYDFIPFLFQDKYLARPLADLYYQTLHTLGQYDLPLAISEATRSDSAAFLGGARDRVVNIGCASDASFFVPGSQPPPAAAQALLTGLGIRQPYVFNLGGMDFRKNWQGLIEAFRLLPDALRTTHQLVLTCTMNEDDVEQVRSHARRHGVARQLVLTRVVPDETLRTLYQHCAVFVFPSLYEGFGLPILEAMHCGVPVVAGRNSSQVEVTGDAGLLVQAADAADIADKMRLVLENPDIAADLRQRSLLQAQKFSWEKTAERFLQAAAATLSRSAWPGLESSEAPAAPDATGSAKASRMVRLKPRLAYFSPLPPVKSGISDYSSRLLEELKHAYTIDVYHDAGYVPHLAFSARDMSCFDYRIFERRASIVNYRGIVYHMGNSPCHRYLYDALLRHPGIVTLHDFALADFHCTYAYKPGAPPDYWQREVEYCCPERAAEVVASTDQWWQEPGGLPQKCTSEGIYLNRRVFEHARTVIVHDPWYLDRIREMNPGYLARTRVIPQGATACALSAEERRLVRSRFNLSEGALIFAAFGLITRSKMLVELVTAFAAVARAHPPALLLFVGQEGDAGATRARVAALGLESRVRFLGHQAAGDFTALAAVTDIGLNLRRPPTCGETSASLLNLVGSGVASIVIDVGTYSSYPDDVVCKVRWSEDVIGSLTETMLQLAGDRRRRERLGHNALDRVRRFHSWSRAASLYIEAIEALDCQSSAA